jgi:hypothetical protein
MCTLDSDCGAGLYCNASGKVCAANCTASGNQCPTAQICDALGRCTGVDAGAGQDSGVPCPTGLMCNTSCPGGGTTTVSGKVYDPALKNPLFNVTVYVPANPLVALPRGVPTGADACNCNALFKSGAVVYANTAEDGSFTLQNVPTGPQVPIVIQIGKWRRLFKLDITPCQDNPQPDKSFAFLGTIPAGDTDDSIPDIAVSTGSADTLECLMRRIGIPTAEYVAGSGGTGHIHVFSGGSNAGGGVGTPENPSMTNAPTSSTDLWMSKDQLMGYDIVLLSCEGGETADANPTALQQYLDVGGRVFASHFHYAWFSGPLNTTQAYTAPTVWRNNIATWTGGGGNAGGPIGGIIETTLNGSSMPFPKGVSLQKWLTNVNGLGKNGVAAGELSIYSPRYNAVVGTTNKESQAWITSDSSAGSPNRTMYLSFDTPVNAAVNDAGVPNYCGRAVFSDLHVGGDPATMDTHPPPDGCSNGDLSPQEKALEFMLFDLSSCVIPDNAMPTGPIF